MLARSVQRRMVIVGGFITGLSLAERQGDATRWEASRRLLLDLDLGSFARATRLTAGEAAALTLVP
jgi:hypothetical protein